MPRRQTIFRARQPVSKLTGWDRPTVVMQNRQRQGFRPADSARRRICQKQIPIPLKIPVTIPDQ